MFAGKRVHLRRLRLSYFVRVSPALGDSFIMNAEHETHCTFAIHVEELFDGVHDKFHDGFGSCVDGSGLARTFFTFCSIGRCSHVFGLSMRFT
jgi:hypothetical protein